MMISASCIFKYRKQYPNDYCSVFEPSSKIMISENGSGQTYISPTAEDDETFLDRLERSKSIGKNLFYEEWDKFEVDNSVVY